MGHVTKREDAAGQTTNYGYDEYYRLTQVTRQPNQYSGQPADPCQTVNYYYDLPLDGSFNAGAALGKLTAVTFGNGTSGPYSTCPGSALDSSTWGGISYQYAYSVAGRTTGKRMTVSRSGNNKVNLDAYWAYDNEGRVLSVQYPVVNDPDTGNPTSTVYSYAYDAMGRPSSMPDGPYTPFTSGVQYNASDQLTQISYFGISESRGYNAMNQLTSLSTSAFSEQYAYTAGKNNGQISSVLEVGTGETVAYTYDSLKRLTNATSSAWGQQLYSYDGFGNMTSKSGNFSVLINPSTNRMTGFSYDANGNLYQGNWKYDVENRLVSVDAAGGEQYVYDPSNKRVYKQGSNGEDYFFYGVDGKVLGEYAVTWMGGTNGTMVLNRITESAYFGGKKVLPAVARDRLGSVRASGTPSNHPYGENYPSVPWGMDGTDGFATYYQDSSTQLNYADQRYYAATYGRFNTPDRYSASGGPSDPGSWNRYSYVGADPVNYRDPSRRIRSLTGPCGNAMVNGVPQDEDCDDGDDSSMCASALNFNPACDNTWDAGLGQAPAGAAPPSPSCNITVAGSGPPRNGQNLIGLTNYSPLKNMLGAYSTIGRSGGAPQGWFYAVQVRANLSGDGNPNDWVGTQTIATSGSVTVSGRSTPVSGSISVHDDSPTFGINQATYGAYDWLDEPGFPNVQFGGNVINASLTDTFTSTVTNIKTHQSCSVNWSVTLSVKGRVGGETFNLQ